MSAIADFLRARYAEDADAVRANWHGKGITSERFHGTPIDPVRLLADLDAKQQVLKAHQRLPEGSFCVTCDAPAGIPGEPDGCTTIRLLALPYASHPEYRSEWMP